MDQPYVTRPLNRAPACGAPIDAFDALTWRAPPPPRPAVVAYDRVDTTAVPRWMIVALGCLIASLLGVIAGSAFAL